MISWTARVTEELDFDIAVVGAGPAGLTAARLAAGAGLATVVFAGSADGRASGDTRTTALMQGAVRLLDRLGLWRDLRPHSAPLRRLRLIDDTDWTIKAPAVAFDSRELGDEPFGWNIPNLKLRAGLEGACREVAAVRILAEDAVHVDVGSDAVRIAGNAGSESVARLVVAADGRNSLCRDAAGIKVTEWSYPQTAIACSFAHSVPHDDTSVEFHKMAGPLTLVPLPGNRSSLVWVATPEDADEMCELPAREFERRLRAETHGILGDVSEVTQRGAFPINGLTARSYAKNRIVLIGEAAHVLPPIGAQGLNLGLRDSALIAELAAQAAAEGNDIASDEVVLEYDRRRRLDVLPRTVLVDFLNRSLFSGMMPLQGLRGLGLFLLDTVGPLRRAVMRQGMEPQTNLPKIMQRNGG